MDYANNGSLRKYLPNIIKFNWYTKLTILNFIIYGFKKLHESNLVHHDLHDGNILISNNEVYITGFELCKPISNLQNSEDIYGVLPDRKSVV